MQLARTHPGCQMQRLPERLTPAMLHHGTIYTSKKAAVRPAIVSIFYLISEPTGKPLYFRVNLVLKLIRFPFENVHYTLNWSCCSGPYHHVGVEAPDVTGLILTSQSHNGNVVTVTDSSLVGKYELAKGVECGTLKRAESTGKLP